MLPTTAAIDGSDSEKPAPPMRTVNMHQHHAHIPCRESYSMGALAGSTALPSRNKIPVQVTMLVPAFQPVMAVPCLRGLKGSRVH